MQACDLEFTLVNAILFWRILEKARNHNIEDLRELRAIDNKEIPDSLSEIMDFSSYDLCTTIRLIVLSGESRTVQVARGSKNGRIYIKGGEICAANTNSCQGDEAFFEMISWVDAQHSDHNEINSSERNLRISTDVLLEIMNNRTLKP